MELSTDRLADLCRRLAPVYPTDGTRAAAAELLALDDPGDALGRALWFLTWQRILWLTLDRLEEAGADLDEIAVSGDKVRQIFASRVPLWTYPPDVRTTCLDLRRTLARHKALLAEPVEALMRSDHEAFIAVSGRAFEAAYPSYATRSEFDTDLLVPRLDDGIRLAHLLHDVGYGLHHARVLGLGPKPEAMFQHRRAVGNHLVGIEVLVGGYYSHKGAITARSRLVPWRGGMLVVPAAEDMLVMVAARVVRKRQFDFVNYNDVAVILREEGASLDWDLVTRIAGDVGVGSVLARLLVGTAHGLGPRPFPPAVWKELARHPLDRAIKPLTARVSDPTTRFINSPSTRRDLRTAAWRGALRVRQVAAGVEPNPLAKIRRRAEHNLYVRQLRRIAKADAKSSVIGRIGRWLRPRCGALCEVDPALAGGERCLSSLGTRPWDDSAGRQLRLLAAQVPTTAGAHRCDDYRFELLTRRR